jgi:polyhydroxyalkanoate synthesis regulator phasin
MSTKPSAKSPSGGRRASSGARSSTKSSGLSDGSSSLAEQLLTRVIKPLGLVVLTRDRIQEILDDAASRGRVTRSDANELAAELVDRGRQQTDQLLSDVERLFGRSRDQIGSTIRARRTESLDLLLRSADRARRTVSTGESFPILGYDDLTAAQVQRRLDGLAPAELRKVRDYERRHANRKSVLGAIDKHLTSD